MPGSGRGIERAELVEQSAAVEDGGHSAVLLSPASGAVQLFEHLDWADTQTVDLPVSEASVKDYDAEVVRDRWVTSCPSLKTDITNAGGEWVDEHVVVDGNVITNRNPADIPVSKNALLEAVNHGMSSAAAAAG